MLDIVEELVAQSRDLESVLLSLAEVLHRVTLVQCVPGYRDAERSDWPAIEELAGTLSAEDAQLYYQIAIKGRNELGLAPDPRTGLEMTLLRMLAFRPANSNEHGGPTPPAAKTLPAADNKPVPSQPAVTTEPAPSAAPSVPVQKTAAPTPEPAIPAPAGDSDWIRMLEQLSISGQVRELARNVELKARDGDRWEFVITPALRHLGSKACIGRLENAISDMLGQAITVRLVDEGKQGLQTAAAAEQQQIHQEMNEAEKAINEDPTVQALKDKMGARIIDDTIQPIQ
jgi:DNA polymerase-3 subunit gamma/tau